MRGIWKTLGGVLVVVVVLLVLAITATIGWRPFIGPRARRLTDRLFESTPARLERGRYLVENLVGCLDCHSERDRASHEAPLVSAVLGAGAVLTDCRIQRSDGLAQYYSGPRDWGRRLD